MTNTVWQLCTNTGLWCSQSYYYKLELVRRKQIAGRVGGIWIVFDQVCDARSETPTPVLIFHLKKLLILLFFCDFCKLGPTSKGFSTSNMAKFTTFFCNFYEIGSTSKDFSFGQKWDRCLKISSDKPTHFLVKHNMWVPLQINLFILFGVNQTIIKFWGID